MPVLAVIVTLLFLTGGTGGARSVSAATGVTTVNVVSLGCGSDNTAIASLNWPTINMGTQWVYWSQNNGFAPYQAAGPYAANVASATVSGLPVNATIYLMVGTVVNGELWPGQTMTFSTTMNCQSYGAANQGQIPWQVLLAISSSGCNNSFFFQDHRGHFDHDGQFHDDDGHFHDGDWDWNDWNGWWNNNWQWNGPNAINWGGWQGGIPFNWAGTNFFNPGFLSVGWPNGAWDPNWGNWSGQWNGNWNGNWAGPWPGTWNGSINGPWNGSWPANWNWNGNWDGTWASGVPFGGLPFGGFPMAACPGFLGHDFFLPAHFHGDFDHHDFDGHDHDHDHDHDDDF
jgi:hypothetical protein